MPTPDARAVEQAIDWLVRLRFNQSDEDARQGFLHWLQERPEHARAWQRVANLGEEFAPLRSELARATLAGGRQRMSRRQSLKALGLCLAAGGLVWMGREHATIPALLADYRSGTGERRSVELGDGTRIQLNSGSAFNVRFDDTRRLIELRRGDLSIEAASDTRPFWVRTRDGDLLAQSPRFLVREEDDATLLAVEQGRVALLGSSPQRVVQGGERVRLRAGVTVSGTGNGLDPWAWVDGVISAHDMRLGDFLTELSRHRPGLLRCTDEVMDLRVSGTYQLADTDQVLTLVSRMLPVRLEYRSRYWVTVRARV